MSPRQFRVQAKPEYAVLWLSQYADTRSEYTVRERSMTRVLLIYRYRVAGSRSRVAGETRMLFPYFFSLHI